MRSAILVAVMLGASFAEAETGAAGWLRYERLPQPVVATMYSKLPRSILSLDDSMIGKSAATELQRGLSSMLGESVQTVEPTGFGPAIVVGTVDQLEGHIARLQKTPAMEAGGFRLTRAGDAGSPEIVIEGADERGELYGVFRLLEMVAQQKSLTALNDVESPAAPVRWVNQWDNMDGSIERGYAGRSIFFDAGHVRSDLTRVGEYGRLLASVGINGCTPNNVNADLKTLTPETLKELSRIADVFRPWGVKMSLSVDLSSPQIMGGLSTFDPLDPAVDKWWQAKVDEIYTLIPDFAGFVVKADSEGRAGPSQYGRTPAEAANVLARALQPHGGMVLYRGFVYNHHLDWHDMKADRARAGYDNFRVLDGKFESNVIIQIKHGPIDFQVREPVSPLFAGLPHTRQAIELQTTQEYTGQQRHMVFLVPMWKTSLDTDMRADNRATPVKEILEGKSFHQGAGGFVSVVNVGLDTNWLHHPMAMANLYGYGRLAWNPDLSSSEIIDSWTRLTFGNNPLVVRTIDAIQLESWRAYENYTGPLGIGGLTDIIGVHFGPGIESAERNGWGQWFRGEKDGIGMDRTVATGTGYIGQYPPELAAKYESLKTCPDELLLFMHHVPYDYRLHSGKTLVQYVYDSHYNGAATAASYVPQWMALKGKIDEERYEQTLASFVYQAGHAIVWRDAVDDWFHKISGIDDARGRVGHHSGRIEAETMESQGYKTIDVTPWETASGGKAVTCDEARCSLTTKLDDAAGKYDIAVQYFDLRTGISSYEMLIDNSVVAQWKADDVLPPAVIDPKLDGHTSTRFTLRGIALRSGQMMVLHGTPEGKEPAPVDYIEITPTTEQEK